MNDYETNRLETIEAIRSIYRRHSAGCCLHIATDDGNLDKHALQYIEDTMNQSHLDCVRATIGLISMKLTGRKKTVAIATRSK